MKKTLCTLLLLLLALSLMPLSGLAGEAPAIKILGVERQIADTVFFSKRETQRIWQDSEKFLADNGVKLDFEIVSTLDQYRSTIQTRLAAGHDLPDMAYVGTIKDNDVIAMAESGVLLPMNKILELTKGAAYKYFYGGEGDRARRMISDADGNFYWLPRIQINLLKGEEKGTSMGVCIRLDWLRKLNLEVPKTLDEFTAALRAFQENDMNGNGIKDEVAVLDTSAFGDGMNYWFGMVNGPIGVNVTEGKVESPWYAPNAKAYFTYVKSLVDEGLLYVDAIGSDSSTDSLRNENKVSALYYYPVGTYAEMPIRAAGVPDAYYIGIKPFEAVEGTMPFYSEETPYMAYLKYAVTRAAKDRQEQMAKYIDLLYSEEMLTLIDWGIKDFTYQETDGQKTRLDWGKSLAQMWDEGSLSFDRWGRYFFPTLRHNERMEEITRTGSSGWPEKEAFEMETADYSKFKVTPNDNSTYYALPTAEESAVLDERLTDLETYSRELAANLSLGRKSLDDWDSYIKELKDLGLDEVLAVRQAQLDRRNGK